MSKNPGHFEEELTRTSLEDIARMIRSTPEEVAERIEAYERRGRSGDTGRW